MDRVEGRTKDDEKEETGFVTSVFQLFSYMYYFHSYYSDTIDEFKDIYQIWMDYMTKLSICNKVLETEVFANKEKLANMNEAKNYAI